MATIKIKSIPIGESLKTILSDKIGDRQIISTTDLIGPQGGVGWCEILLSDSSIVIVGEKMFSWRPMPKWILNRYPGIRFENAGSGSRWRAYISTTDLSGGCVCQICGRIYRIDFIIPDDVWKTINPKQSENGLLCGRCITDKMETMYKKCDKFGCYNVTKI